MVNNKIKEEFEQRNREQEEYDDQGPNSEQKTNDLNQLLEQMSGKLPRSDFDEYETNSESSDEDEEENDKRYKNKK